MSKIAVVDTCVFIMMLDDDATKDPRRVQLVKTLSWLRDDAGASFVLPTVALAEMERLDTLIAGIQELGERVRAGMRVVVFDDEAADVARKMRHKINDAGLKGEDRRLSRYDALIAATAVSVGARWLVTTNPTDYDAHLAGTGVEVVRADKGPPSGAQLTLQERTSKKTLLQPAKLGGSGGPKALKPPKK